MKIGAIIFFRMNSKRLPGKPLLKFKKKNLIDIIYDRVLKIKGLDEIIIATSTEKFDNPIYDHCKKNSYKVFRGSLNNVAKRALLCAEKYNLNYFLRVCGDRPFYDIYLATKQIQLCREKNYDIITNCFPKTFSTGLDSELISFQTFNQNFEFFNSDYEKEHITYYFYKNCNNFKIHNFINSQKELRSYSLAIDNYEDYLRIKFLYSKLGNNDFNCLELKTKLKLLNKFKK